MATIDLKVIDNNVQKSLEGTDFASTGVQKLVGGSVNYVYYAPLSKPLSDGTTEVLVKHAETHMARKPEFPLPLIRSKIEYECLKGQSDIKISGNLNATDVFDFVVRTPKLYHFDFQKGNQIMEYVPNSIDLKSYIIEHYPPPTTNSFKPQCFSLGAAIGKWLRHYHDTIMQKSEVLEAVKRTDFTQQVKQMINYTWLFERLKTFPDILEEARQTFEDVAQQAATESKTKINHGDFWPGNILIPNRPIQADNEIVLAVIDWESSQLGPISVDVGEMLAELHALWIYKGITAGLWMMEGFASGYGEDSEDSVFRTAIQMGAHLVCVTTDDPTWGTPEQARDVVRAGRDIIVHAWRKDRKWFEQSGFRSLFNAC